MDTMLITQSRYIYMNTRQTVFRSPIYGQRSTRRIPLFYQRPFFSISI